jgi:hypothetical protein
MKLEAIATLEKVWKENFKKSILVVDGEFKPEIAKSLFYGKSQKIKSTIDVGFKSHYGANLHMHNLESIVSVIEFLEMIGIIISEAQLRYAIQSKKISFNELYRRVYFIFQTLANSSSDLDIDNPYVDNQGDVYFLLKVVIGYNKGRAKFYRIWAVIGKILFENN